MLDDVAAAGRCCSACCGCACRAVRVVLLCRAASESQASDTLALLMLVALRCVCFVLRVDERAAALSALLALSYGGCCAVSAVCCLSRARDLTFVFRVLPS